METSVHFKWLRSSWTSYRFIVEWSHWFWKSVYWTTFAFINIEYNSLSFDRHQLEHWWKNNGKRIESIEGITIFTIVEVIENAPQPRFSHCFNICTERIFFFFHKEQFQLIIIYTFSVAFSTSYSRFVSLDKSGDSNNRTKKLNSSVWIMSEYDSVEAIWKLCVCVCVHCVFQAEWRKWFCKFMLWILKIVNCKQFIAYSSHTSYSRPLCFNGHSIIAAVDFFHFTWHLCGAVLWFRPSDQQINKMR